MDHPLTARRRELVDAWIEGTLATYPAPAARFMAAEADPFRNPAGHALRENLGVLFDAAILAEDWEAATRALEELVRVRAVQDFSAQEAIQFIAMLEDIVERAVGPVPDLHPRIERLSQIAAGVYAACRERLETIRTNEVQRRSWNLARVRR